MLDLASLFSIAGYTPSPLHDALNTDVLHPGGHFTIPDRFY
jgi:hypothetical protein